MSYGTCTIYPLRMDIVKKDVFFQNSKEMRSLVRTPARTIPRISQLEIHSVYQAVIGTGFTWQCGGIAQLVELLI